LEGKGDSGEMKIRGEGNGARGGKKGELRGKEHAGFFNSELSGLGVLRKGALCNTLAWGEVNGVWEKAGLGRVGELQQRCEVGL